MSPRPSSIVERAAVVAALSLMTACFTGQRATMVEPPPGGETGQPTGDANADDVLELLEPRAAAAFTATYELTLVLTGTVTAASVTEDAVSRRSVTIGGIRYLSTGVDQTCAVATGACEAGLLDARTSDVGFTSGFDRSVPARRLRLAVSRMIGPTTATTEVIAGLPATCVSVPVGSGSEQYCVLQTGGLARWDAADVHVELTAFQGVATEDLLRP